MVVVKEAFHNIKASFNKERGLKALASHLLSARSKILVDVAPCLSRVKKVELHP
jgi:hypothetical protein